MRYRPRRSPSRYASTAEVHGRLLRITVRDVSAEGARIEGAGRLAVGAPCALRILDGTVTARVRWSGDDVAGIRFDRPLSRRQFDTLRQAATTRRHGTTPRQHFTFTEMR